MFKTMIYFIAVTSASLSAMQSCKEEREPRKDNPYTHVRSPEQKMRKQEKSDLNNLRNSQKAVDQQTLINAVKGKPSAHNVLQRILDSE